MLDFDTKIVVFEKLLLTKNNSYADSIKEEIHSYFFEQLGNSSNTENFSFLNSLFTQDDINSKVDLLVSKIIMHEHHAGVEDLIIEYMSSNDSTDYIIVQRIAIETV